MRSRDTSTLKAKLEHNLLAYATAASAASLGITAMVPPASAEIIYTPAHCRLETGGLKYCGLDIDQKVGADFVVYARFYRGSVFLKASGQGYSDQIQYQSDYFANARKPGGKIGPRKHFDTGNEQHPVAVRTNSGAVSGPWANVKNRYLGLRISAVNGFNYGWGRFNVQFGQDHTWHATLTGYAYETETNKPIVAGDEGRGASLGHLALGAVGRKH